MHQATPKLPKDQFRRVCYNAIDLIVSAIDQRFNQESFSSYAQMETLLVKTANGDDYDTEFKFLEASYSEDVDTGALPRLATKYFGSYVKGEDIMLFPEPEKELIQEVQTICKLPAINPATSVLESVHSYLSARRLKTWFPSGMGDLAVLNGRGEQTVSL